MIKKLEREFTAEQQQYLKSINYYNKWRILNIILERWNRNELSLKQLKELRLETL